VVRRAGEDGDGAIDLFGQHRPRQGVGPRLGAEREPLGGSVQDARIQAVGAADDEGDAAQSLVAQALEALGEGAGGEGPAMFVAGDQRPLGEVREERLGLGRLPRATGLDFQDLDRGDPQGPAGGGRPRRPVQRQPRLGRCAQAPDADEDDGEAQRPPLSGRGGERSPPTRSSRCCRSCAPRGGRGG
jgi:hypothetical protein